MRCTDGGDCLLVHKAWCVMLDSVGWTSLCFIKPIVLQLRHTVATFLAQNSVAIWDHRQQSGLAWKVIIDFLIFGVFF